MIKVEVLFPELCNIYGDLSNIKYLEKHNCFDIVKTNNNEEPYFIKHKINMLYIGSMTENNQELAISRLLNYKKEIKKLIEDDVVILATGNAFEMFGKYIEQENKKIQTLDFFNYYSVRDINHRHNSLFVGEFNKIKIVGNKSQFSSCYGDLNFIKVVGGFGSNDDSLYEGYKYKNFYGTYLLGPLLILNPLFTQYLFKLLKTNSKIICEKELMEAYDYRLKKLLDDNARFTMGDHG